MDDLSTQLLRADLDIECPACGFVMWVLMSEVVAQVNVVCSCCRTDIHLVDDRGGMSTAGDVIESTIAHALKGMF